MHFWVTSRNGGGVSRVGAALSAPARSLRGCPLPGAGCVPRRPVGSPVHRSATPAPSPAVSLSPGEPPQSPPGLWLIQKENAICVGLGLIRDLEVLLKTLRHLSTFQASSGFKGQKELNPNLPFCSIPETSVFISIFFFLWMLSLIFKYVYMCTGSCSLFQ